MEIRIEVPSNTTFTTITDLPEKNETYNCSVQARNNCQLLSNHSIFEFVDIYVTPQGNVITGISVRYIIHCSKLMSIVLINHQCT